MRIIVLAALVADGYAAGQGWTWNAPAGIEWVRLAPCAGSEDRAALLVVALADGRLFVLDASGGRVIHASQAQPGVQWIEPAPACFPATTANRGDAPAVFDGYEVIQLGPLPDRATESASSPASSRLDETRLSLRTVSPPTDDPEHFERIVAAVLSGDGAVVLTSGRRVLLLSSEAEPRPIAYVPATIANATLRAANLCDQAGRLARRVLLLGQRAGDWVFHDVSPRASAVHFQGESDARGSADGPRESDFRRLARGTPLGLIDVDGGLLAFTTLETTRLDVASGEVVTLDCGPALAAGLITAAGETGGDLQAVFINSERRLCRWPPTKDANTEPALLPADHRWVGLRATAGRAVAFASDTVAWFAHGGGAPQLWQGPESRPILGVLPAGADAQPDWVMLHGECASLLMFDRNSPESHAAPATHETGLASRGIRQLLRDRNALICVERSRISVQVPAPAARE